MLTAEDRDMLMESFRDVYRDATGCRPSADTVAYMRSLSDEDFERDFDFWAGQAEAEAQREAVMALAAQKSWETKMTEIAKANGVPFSTAVRWDCMAYGADDDAGYYCYLNGLAYELEARITGLMEQEKRMAA